MEIIAKIDISLCISKCLRSFLCLEKILIVNKFTYILGTMLLSGVSRYLWVRLCQKISISKARVTTSI